VLDANVFVSAILSPTGIPGRIVVALRKEQFSIVISTVILAEIGRVLRYPRIKKRHGLPEKEIEAFLAHLIPLGVITPGRLSLSVVADDPTDDRYIECAVEGGADYIVSGDAHLLRLRRYEDIQIVTPKEFHNILRSS